MVIEKRGSQKSLERLLIAFATSVLVSMIAMAPAAGQQAITQATTLKPAKASRENQLKCSAYTPGAAPAHTRWIVRRKGSRSTEAGKVQQLVWPAAERRKGHRALPLGYK